MIKINVLCLGKVKEKYFAEGINEYKKRLSKYCDFNIIEKNEENYSKVNNSTIPLILEKESKEILPELKGYVICFAIEGKKLSSVEFAEKIKNISDKVGVITFVIGSSYGLNEKIKEKANQLISFSDLTFPHTLFRLMLTEQIYRAFSINSGSSYHK